MLVQQSEARDYDLSAVFPEAGPEELLQNAASVTAWLKSLPLGRRPLVKVRKGLDQHCPPFPPGLLPPFLRSLSHMVFHIIYAISSLPGDMHILWMTSGINMEGHTHAVAYSVPPHKLVQNLRSEAKSLILFQYTADDF